MFVSTSRFDVKRRATGNVSLHVLLHIGCFSLCLNGADTWERCVAFTLALRLPSALAFAVAFALSFAIS